METKQILFGLFFIAFSSNLFAQPEWKGNGSTSAIGQLEYMTGTTIQSGGNSGTYESPTYYQPSQEEMNQAFENIYFQKAESENSKGLKAADAGDWDSAIKHFKKAVKLYPSSQTFQNNLSNAEAQKEYLKKKNMPPELTLAQKDFIQTYNSDRKKYKTQLERLEAIKSKVPPLGYFDEKKKVESGFMLGIFNEETEYLTNPDKLINPFNGKSYKEGEFFAGTDRVSSFEICRALLDSWTIGEYTLSTDYGKKLVQRINGTHFKTLIAHSNGATITEALIRDGHIKVDELNIIGGDRSLMNNDGYDALIKQYGVKKIIVWVNPYDLVPVGSSSLKMFKNSKSYNAEYADIYDQYVNHSIKGSGQPNPNIEYRFLSGSEYSDGQGCCTPKELYEAHLFASYLENMKTYWKIHGKD
jgi:hypothetical protein